MPSTAEKTITPEIMTIDQIEVSPLNVRRHRATIEAIGAMQASIVGRGLIQPLNLHPMRGSKTKFGAFAGGRRSRAIRALVDAGKLPADWPIRVEVYRGYSDVEIIELSLGENIERAQLELYEICAAIRALDARNETVQSIAAAIGQPEDIVARWRRVGRLAEPVFEAFANGLITTDQARAFAATEDGELQRVTFEQLREQMPSPADIRRAMKIGDRRAQADLTFVGVERYRHAGGRFELDLFADETEERGRIVDEGILQRLVQEKRETILAEVRATVRRPDLRFIAETPKDQWRGVDHQLAVSPKRLPSGGLELPDGDIVAHLAIDPAGEPVVSYWWESRKAKFGNERTPAAAAVVATPTPPAVDSPFTAHHRAEAAQRDEGLSNDALFALSAVRKVILRAGLIDDARRADGTVGLELLIWSQAIALLRPGTRSANLGIRTMSAEDTPASSDGAFALAREHVGATEAARTAAKAVAEISQRPFMRETDPVESFALFCAEEEDTIFLIAAVVAGIVLERSLAAPDYDRPVHDLVAQMVGIETEASVRSYWTPTGDMLDMLPKAQRLAIAEPFVDRATFATWAKLKSGDLTSGLLALLTRAGSKGATWVHPLLRFSSSLPADQAEVREAAE